MWTGGTKGSRGERGGCSYCTEEIDSEKRKFDKGQIKININFPTMKFSTTVSCALLAVGANAFAPRTSGVSRPTSLNAEIRGPTDKSDELRFGWDGTTALGGAVEVAAPTRMLDQIRESGETIPSECEVFNANVEMDSDSLKFQEVMDLINTHYEVGLIEFKNGDIVNKPGENEGSGMVLSYAALSGMDKDTTLKLWGEYYREVVADPDGDSHANIRNFMKTGWEGVPFENGISLTKKCAGEADWDWDAESWIP